MSLILNYTKPFYISVGFRKNVEISFVQNLAHRFEISLTF